MKILLAIGVGSFIGGVLRHLLSHLISYKTIGSFPFGTLFVNILGCLLIGMVYGYTEKGVISGDWKLFLATGVLGGFTTYSAFSYETMQLIRDNNMTYAITYILSTVILGLVATFAGLAVAKII